MNSFAGDASRQIGLQLVASRAVVIGLEVVIPQPYKGQRWCFWKRSKGLNLLLYSRISAWMAVSATDMKILVGWLIVDKRGYTGQVNRFNGVALVNGNDSVAWIGQQRHGPRVKRCYGVTQKGAEWPGRKREVVIGMTGDSRPSVDTLTTFCHQDPPHGEL